MDVLSSLDTCALPHLWRLHSNVTEKRFFSKDKKEIYACDKSLLLIEQAINSKPLTERKAFWENFRVPGGSALEGEALIIARKGLADRRYELGDRGQV